MVDFFSDLTGLGGVVQTLSNTIAGALNTTQQIGFEMVHSLNDTLISNREKFVKDIKQNMLELISQASDKAKESANEVIANAGQTLSITAELAIERAKNTTTAVFDETLEKIRHEMGMIVNDFITNQIVIAIGTFLFIILLLMFGYLFLHIHTALGYGAQSVKVMLKMILILVYPLLCVFYGFSLVWFVKNTMEMKSPAYIIGICIIVAPVLYLLCYLACWNKVQSAIKRVYETVSKRWAARKRNRGDLKPPGGTNTAL